MLKEIEEFLARMLERYDPDAEYHEQMMQMLTQLSCPLYTREQVIQRMRWMEREYVFEAEQKQRLREVNSLCQRLDEETDPKKIRRLESSIDDKAEELGRLRMEHVERVAKETEEMILNTYSMIPNVN